VEHAAVYLPGEIPSEALMLVTDEAPAAYWYVAVLYALLGVLSALVIWAFLRTLRPEKGSTGAAASL
jgi:hypothetical protein